MTNDDASQKLFAAAIVAGCRELDYRSRSLLISVFPPCKSESMNHVAEALDAACANAGIASVMLCGQDDSRVRDAALHAGRWSRAGVFVITLDQISSPAPHLHDPPPILFCLGPRNLLHEPAAAVLNSRRGLQVRPDDPWLKATARAVHGLKSDVRTVVSSYGTLPYNVVTSLASSLPLVLACDGALPSMVDESSAQRFHREHHDLFSEQKTLLISPFPPGSLPPRRERMRVRDRLVAALSSEIIAIAPRPDGNVQEILAVASKRGAMVRTIRTPDSVREGPGQSKTAGCLPGREAARPNATPPGRKMGRRLCPDSRDDPSHGSGDYLFHYTRSCPGPWPGQTMGQYCRSLTGALPGAAHTGFDTLCRIIEENLIRASGRLTRASEPVVSLTELRPHEVMDLSQWRTGLIRWSFEPYGIGFPRSRMFQLGARPVIYAVKDAFQDLSDDLRYLFQLQGPSGKTWSEEKEWRFKGDFALSLVDRDGLLVVVPEEREAREISRRFGSKVWACEK